MADGRRRRRDRPRRRPRWARTVVLDREGRRASRSASRCRAPCSTVCARATTTASSASSTSCPRACARSLYLKDDDYRLSFLYGNFTTLTRFTEADLERVVTERLSPLHVSIHSTDPVVRSQMLKNARGGMSLRWLRALLDHDITVRGQIVVCPGRERRRGARRHVRRDPRPVPRTRLGGDRAARHLQVQRRGGDAAAHRRRGACGGRRRRRLAGRVPGHARQADAVRRRRVLPDGRTGRSRTPSATTGSRCTRTASAWPARSKPSSTACRAHGHRRAARASSPPPMHRRTRRPTPPCTPPLVRGSGTAHRRRHRRRRRRPVAVTLQPRRSAPIGVLTGELGARDHRSARRVARPPRRPRARGRQRVLRRQHRRHRPDDRRGRQPHAGRPARRPPLPAARRVPVRRGPVPRRRHRRPSPTRRRDRADRRHLAPQRPERNTDDAHRERIPDDRPHRYPTDRRRRCRRW